MSRDFTPDIYEALLRQAIDSGYLLTSYENYLLSKDLPRKIMILRHDVDKLPQNALSIAELQADLGVKGTYYFRIVRQSFDPAIIKKIKNLGHEIGYHYEDLTLCKGNVEKAIRHFEESLRKFRQLYPVKTICMHGSPLSKWDNRDLWKHYDYRDYDILAEPYFDLDFSKVLYLTDTGRRWDGARVSVRDKVQSSFANGFSTTQQIIEAFRSGQLPSVIMQNIHPQRWHGSLWPWYKELFVQNLKNQVKRIFFVRS